MGDQQEKHPDHLQAELGLPDMWPKLGSNPQGLDDKRFRVLKISVLNHSAKGAASKLLAFIDFSRVINKSGKYSTAIIQYPK